MHNSILNSINDRITLLNSIIAKLTERIESAPDGKLRVVQRENSVEYYQRLSPSEKNGKYVSKTDSELIAALAQKEYDRRALACAERELKICNRMVKFYQDGTYETTTSSMPDRIAALVTPEHMSDEDFIKQWLSKPAKFLQMNEKDKHFSCGNIFTRSKSEHILATDLKDFGLPFLYERGLFLPLTEKWVYPDFTLLDPETREEIYWEHFGMMDDPKYANRAIEKLNEYEINGFHLGHQLIATFESKDHPLDIELVEGILSDISSGKWPVR